MRTLAHTGLTLLLFFAAACSHEQKSTQKFFDFDGLIDEQINNLSQRKRVLDKVASVRGDKSDSTFLPTAEGWESELGIFRQLELINKPIFQNAYQVVGPMEDTKSNLKIRQYVGPSTPMPLVKFYYQNEFSRLKKIEAAITERNLLFTNSRSLSMEFEEEQGGPALIRYAMSGYQKMVFGDTIRFSVKGQIDW